jgi:hypothetical protein
MNVETILKILKTREEAAKMSGNTTELSLMYELTKAMEDYKRLKEQMDEN